MFPTYRFFSMIMTSLCILDVDFKIFARRYAKTETYGTSLVIGACIFSGYLGNYLFNGNNSTSKMRSCQWLTIRISIVCAVLWLLTIILDKHVETVSAECSDNNHSCDGNLGQLGLHGPLDSLSSTPKTIQGTSNSTTTTTTTKVRKRCRRPKTRKNKEEAETQRLTHIVVERNRRKQMNEYLAVLRSLMPESYAHKGDQASIVGGAIEYVKELEQLLQSLEAQKRLQLQQKQAGSHCSNNFFSPPFSQFFTCPQFSWCQVPGDYPLENRTTIADIEVTLIESHANIRVLSRWRPRQLFRIVAGFHSLHLTILHLNVTTLEPMVLYSFSAKVEEACHLTSVDDLAGAVHHMLRIIEEEAALG